ncbi:MAG: AAA family ATPase [Spiroplasma ixodetis]|nr:AAA family ATPase [Spiroplasma ixodetis]MBP1526572.1 AAA family ATPase [Spiroplasma ixodetis]MBP1527890.1 AAA family ATPase [Spiroplasma ixodetis]
MKMISFAVKKGGVGKTTLCKNIAYKLALENKKILLIDLDPQATLTLNFAYEKLQLDKTLLPLILKTNILKIEQLIQKSKYENIDIIVASEEINKSSTLINTFYSEKDKYLVADLIYQNNQEIFDSYDYVLIDYPPTMQELALNFLILSDLIIIPLTDDGGCYKGLLDLKNTLNQVARNINKNVSNIKIILNNIKNNDVNTTILKWLKEADLSKFLFKTQIKHSDTFAKNTVKLDTIWTNPTYWRQKQAYEELIAEIM